MISFLATFYGNQETSSLANEAFPKSRAYDGTFDTSLDNGHDGSSSEESNPANGLYPIAVLIDELKNEDSLSRLKAVKQLLTIALALGAERTRDELLPFISEAVYDDDDILLALAEQLGRLVPYVGGKDHAYTIITPLEQLSAIEEQLVRECAAAQLANICRE